jgi:shikimate kinase
MEGYYDCGPLVLLDRPVALTGFIGSKLPQIASSVVALTGLPLADLDRWIEHEAGTAVEGMVLRQGEIAMRRMESRLLDRALESRPPGIIVLGEGTLLDSDNRRKIRRHAKLVYIELSIFELYAALRAEWAHAPMKHCHLFVDPPGDIAEVESLFKHRISSYRDADVLVRGSHKYTLDIAMDVIKILEPLPPSSPAA